MTSGATTSAVRQQVAAMGCELFEVGVFRPETAGTDGSMLLRGWNPDTLLRALPCFQLQSPAGRDKCKRPKGTLIQSRGGDLTAGPVTVMEPRGCHPAQHAPVSSWCLRPEDSDFEQFA